MCLLMSFNAFTQEVPPITINVEKAGTLSSYIADSKKHEITDLTITGNLNGNDISFLREISGSDDSKQQTESNLKTLDLYNANIVSGGKSYVFGSYYTQDNRIGGHMFTGCTFTSIKLPKSITKIDDCAFQYCSNLNDVEIPIGTTYIGRSAFDECSKLTTIQIPDGVTKLGAYVFNKCGLITSITLPSSVIDLSKMGWISGAYYEAFGGLDNLKEINVSPENQIFSSNNGILLSKDGTELIYCPPAINIETYTIPDNIIKVWSKAFYYCNNLKSIIIPHAIETEGHTFNSNLVRIQTLEKEPFTIEDNCFSYVDKDKCILYVPEGSYNAYWLARWWGDFKNIIEKNEIVTSNQMITPDIFGIQIINETIHLYSHRKILISIFNIRGQLMKELLTEGNQQLYLPKGIYIVKAENQSQKVIIK